MMCVCVCVCVQLTDAADSVAGGVLPNFLDLCLFNIAQTDEQTVTEAIQSFDASAEISIVSVRILNIMNLLISLVCPGQPPCNGRGQCLNAVCVCESGMYRICAVDTCI